jgi:hypothetical protein
MNLLLSINTLEAVTLASVILTSLGTIATIIFVNSNTNKQIKNQNIQTYRPYLTLDSSSHLEDFIILNFKNIGYGVAKNVKIANIGNQDISFILHRRSSFKMTDGQRIMEAVEQLDIGKNDLGMIYLKKKDKSTISDSLFLFIYHDLNNNQYICIVRVIFKNIFMYNEKDKNFNNILKKHDINISNLKANIKTAFYNET